MIRIDSGPIKKNRATLDPVKFFLHSLWEGWVPKSMLAGCISELPQGLAWAACKGPLSALSLTLRRVGIRMAQPFFWEFSINKEGMCLMCFYMRSSRPFSVALL